MPPPNFKPLKYPAELTKARWEHYKKAAAQAADQAKKTEKSGIGGALAAVEKAHAAFAKEAPKLVKFILAADKGAPSEADKKAHQAQINKTAPLYKAGMTALAALEKAVKGFNSNGNKVLDGAIETIDDASADVEAQFKQFSHYV